MKLRFTKMHGIGNDFVVVDCREQPLGLSTAQIAHVGDRHRGVGFDQLLTIEPSQDACSWNLSVARQPVNARTANGIATTTLVE